MLSKKQVEEIKEHLEKAQNPVFFFDNDVDGLCSFLLLRRYIERGRGVAIKSFPDLSVDYFRKVRELNADYIFILDKHAVSKEFFKEVEQVNIPVVWIDHHDVEVGDLPNFVSYFNPSREPVTAFCYQITQREEDLWIAIVGCISDRYLPSYYTNFQKSYPELTIDSDNAFEIVFNSEIGKIERMLNYGLKDSITNVVNMLKFLFKAKTPYDVLEENNKNKRIHERFREIDVKSKLLMKKAMAIAEGKSNVLIFEYGGEMAISANLSNALMHRFPEKVIVVIYNKGATATISVRGENVRDKVQKIIEKFDNATCGGHEDAVGAKIILKDLDEFKEKVKKVFEK